MSNWEYVAEGVYRAIVPGGWLYRYVESIAFVPDPGQAARVLVDYRVPGFRVDHAIPPTMVNAERVH